MNRGRDRGAAVQATTGRESSLSEAIIHTGIAIHMQHPGAATAVCDPRLLMFIYGGPLISNRPLRHLPLVSLSLSRSGASSRLFERLPPRKKRRVFNHSELRTSPNISLRHHSPICQLPSLPLDTNSSCDDRVCERIRSHRPLLKARSACVDPTSPPRCLPLPPVWTDLSPTPHPLTLSVHRATSC